MGYIPPPPPTRPKTKVICSMCQASTPAYKECCEYCNIPLRKENEIKT